MTEDAKFLPGDRVRVKQEVIDRDYAWRDTKHGILHDIPGELIKFLRENGPVYTIHNFVDDRFDMGGRYSLIGMSGYVIAGTSLELDKHMPEISDVDIHKLLML
jgi:hypothetical protein